MRGSVKVEADVDSFLHLSSALGLTIRAPLADRSLITWLAMKNFNLEADL